MSHPALSTIGAVDEDGNVDIDGLAEMIKEQISDHGFKVTVPILGELTFFKEDVEKLLEYIKE